MKKDNIPAPTNTSEVKDPMQISRKEAILKAGKLAALTAATLTFMATKASAAGSPQEPGWGTPF